MEPCLVCGENIEYENFVGHSSVNCPRCGQYKVTGTAYAMLKAGNFNARQLANLSGWLKENEGYLIDSDNLTTLKSLPTPSFHERSDSFLLGLEKLSSYAGEILEFQPTWLAIAWAINDDEFREVIKYLKSVKFIGDSHSTLGKIRLKIEPDGWAHLSTLKKVNQQSTQGFVAMWFSDEMFEIYDSCISIGILAAGYKPHVVSQREHNGKIDDEIIAQIRSSRFVLADFTGHRGGVYFEAGFAKGLGIEVIWSCRKDEIDDLHFDIRQYNCITWEPDKLDEFCNKIKNRIEAVIGHGSYKE